MAYAGTWTALVGKISDALVADLSANGLPPLSVMPDGSPGKILMGHQWVTAHWGCPKIVMVPTGFRTGPRSVAMRGPTDTTEILSEMSMRSIGTQLKQFEVHAWNCNFDGTVGNFVPNPDPDLDWDAVDSLYNALWRVTHLLCAGIWETRQGTIDRKAAEWSRMGRYAVLDLAISTPILDVALPFAPSGVVGKTTSYLQPADGGGPEQGCAN